jgi:LPXTG-site transpeptidase (sortase) family protein
MFTNQLFEQIWKNKLAFFGTFFLVFTLSYIVLMALDFLPEPRSENSEAIAEETLELETVSDSDAVSEMEANEEVESVAAASEDEEPVAVADMEESIAVLPTSIYIEKLDKTVTVLNPTSRSIADLDNALLAGVVRHPDSATFGQTGTMFILGHSSYLPNVFNKNFQAFNGIQDLAWGDSIEVSSSDRTYLYRVEKVYRAKLNEVTVPIAGNSNKLTLATCNSFGSVDDRYIVEAKQVEARNI